MAIVPVPLSDTSISAGQGSMLTRFGYRFEVAWPSKEVKGGESIAIFASESKQQVVLFFDPAKKPDVLKTFKDSWGSQRLGLSQVYGAKALQSNYELDRAIVNACPSQLSYIFPGRKQVGLATLLILKKVETVDAETGIYSFESGHLRGFQNGDPARAGSVHVKAFDDGDRQFEFVFTNKLYPNAGLTQADINRVLQTLRPAPALPDAETTVNYVQTGARKLGVAFLTRIKHPATL